MRCIILLNGTIEHYSAFDGFFFKSDFILCADGGMRHAKEMGVTPHVVLGDFDSFDKSQIQDVQVIEYPARKDQTDGEIAVEYALEYGFDEILLLGALGGRLDHMLANIFLLEKIAKQGKAGMIYDGLQQVYYMNGGMLKLNGQAGELLSIIPISDRVEGVTLTGFEYPLHNCTLVRGSTHGISNVFAEDTVTIAVRSGAVLVVKSKEN